jgi:RHS repeat-associated protein
VKGNVTFLPSSLQPPASRLLFWDFDNQLTGVDTTGDNVPDVTYEYDVLHRRVARIQTTFGGTSRVYIHAGNQIIADYTRGALPTTTPAYRYVWGDFIDEPILRETSTGTTHYFHHNQQYSTIALTNAPVGGIGGGEVIERYGYTAYGQFTVLTALGIPTLWPTNANRYLFTGREWDDTTKLFHVRARWYEPLLGRFVSRDPLEYIDGMSMYRGYFVPNVVDPLGKDVIVLSLVPNQLQIEIATSERVKSPVCKRKQEGFRKRVMQNPFGRHDYKFNLIGTRWPCRGDTGVFVQKVDVACDESPCPPCKPEQTVSDKFTYWEAFKVVREKAPNVRPGHDENDLGAIRNLASVKDFAGWQSSHLRGSYIQNGEVKFFCLNDAQAQKNSPVADSPFREFYHLDPTIFKGWNFDKWIPNEGSPCRTSAGDLPWTQTEPDFWKGDDFRVIGPVSRSFDMSWNCCDKKDASLTTVPGNNRGDSVISSVSDESVK